MALHKCTVDRHLQTSCQSVSQTDDDSRLALYKQGKAHFPNKVFEYRGSFAFTLKIIQLMCGGHLGHNSVAGDRIERVGEKKHPAQLVPYRAGPESGEFRKFQHETMSSQ